MEIKIEASTSDQYNKVMYNNVGKVGDIIGNFNIIIDWMKDRGLNAGVSRYSRYLGYMRDFQGKDEPPEKVWEMYYSGELAKRYDKADNALLEILQIKRVYEEFQNYQSNGFQERLKKVVAGKDFYYGGEPDKPRDFLYELLVAAWFSRVGYEIDFDAEEGTDVVAHKDGRTVLIECKRPKSSKKYEENYRKGCKQLAKVDNLQALKFVFMDIRYCISDMAPAYEYRDFLHIVNTVNKAIDYGFVKTNRSLTNRILTEFSHKVDGIVLTAVGNYGVNKSDDIEIEHYIDKRVLVYDEIDQERQQLVIDTLKEVNF